MRTPQLSGLPEATAARARRRAVKQHFRSARKLGDRGRVLGLLSCLGGVFTTPRVARTGISDIQRCGHWLLQGRMGITEPCSKRFVHYSDVGELSEFGLGVVFPNVNSVMLRKIRTVVENLPILLAFIRFVRII
uniref:uncharacterized protein LOC118538564 isoform X3 n=1 Tax=Halichoerus grypus TaxID=9711 RepID=UPI0016599C86|nr:uncharacterized protein LOC118538564 isoform X3 [Halichoerus grypus]